MFQLFDFFIHYYPNFLLLLVLTKTFSSKRKRKFLIFGVFLFLLSIVDYGKLYTFNTYKTQSAYIFIQFFLIITYLCIAWIYTELTLSGWSLYHISLIIMWWFFYESERTFLGPIIMEYTNLGITILLVLNDLLMTLFSFLLIRLHFNFSMNISPFILMILGALSLFIEFFVYQELNISGIEQCYVVLYITLIMLFTYWCIATIIRQMETLLVQARQELLQEAEVQNARTLYKNIRIIRHETRNHFTLLSALLQQKKYNELQTYFDEYLSETTYLLSSVSSGNDVVDAILNQELWKIRKQQIPVDMKAELPSSLQIHMSDLGAVLFNSIDNALDASLRTQSPFIFVELCKRKNYLMITVKNKVDDDIMQSNPKLHTTKSSSDLHGNGISIIKNIASKYEGDVTFSQNNNFFQISVMLKDISISK